MDIRTLLSHAVYLLVLFILTNSCTKQKGNKSIVQEYELLEVVDVFPKKGMSNFFKNPVSIDFSKNGLFVSDQRASKVYNIDKSGNILPIGTEGKAPDELNQQRDVYINGDTLVVNNGYYIQLYNFDGDIMNYFPSFSVDGLVMHKGRFYVARPSTDPYVDENFNDENVIKIVNKNGEIESEICSVLEFVPTDSPYYRFLASSVYIEEYDDKLYVLFRYYPYLRVFDIKSRRIIQDINLADKFPNMDYTNRASVNYNPQTFETPGRVSTKFLFKELEVNEKGLFLAVYSRNRNLIIDHLQHDLTHVKRMVSNELHNNFSMTDFTTSDDGQSIYSVGYYNGAYKILEIDVKI